MHDSFDSNRIMPYAKKDHVIADYGHSSFRADFGTHAMNSRLFGDLLHPSSKQTKQPRCMARAVLGDIIHDLFQVSGHTRG